MENKYNKEKWDIWQGRSKCWNINDRKAPVKDSRIKTGMRTKKECIDYVNKIETVNQ
jgi:hypothetical protein